MNLPLVSEDIKNVGGGDNTAVPGPNLAFGPDLALGAPGEAFDSASIPMYKQLHISSTSPCF